MYMHISYNDVCTSVICTDMNNAFCAMKSWIAPKLPNDWLATMNKKTPSLHQRRSICHMEESELLSVCEVLGLYTWTEEALL